MANEIKTADDLRGAFPALVDQIEQEAAKRAVDDERKRIQDIEEMALPGSEKMTNEAKFTKPMSASDYAMAMVKNAKNQGAAYLANAADDAENSGAGGVQNEGTPTPKTDEFMDALKSAGKKQ